MNDLLLILNIAAASLDIFYYHCVLLGNSTSKFQCNAEILYAAWMTCPFIEMKGFAYGLVTSYSSLLPLEEGELVSNTTSVTVDEGPRQCSLVVDCHGTVSKVSLVQEVREWHDRAGVNGSVSLDIAGLSVDDVSHRLPFIGVVSVPIND